MVTNSTNCAHSEEERALYGTWTSVEVRKAIEMGYKVLKVYEIYEFKNKAKNL
jgi:2-keto-3-deoxy-6-phosphogluconate aldolase